MPRPVRRPKKVERRAEAVDSGKTLPQSVSSRELSPILDDRSLRSVSTALERAASPIVNKQALSLSDDEFGFHELHDVHPVLRRPNLEKAADPTNDSFIFADPAEDDDDPEDVSSLSSPVLGPVAVSKQDMSNTRMTALKTAELQNLLPRNRHLRTAKKRPIRDQENEDSGSEESDSAARRKNRPSKRKKPTPISENRAKAPPRPMRTSRKTRHNASAEEESDEEGEEEEEEEPVNKNHRVGISDADRKRLSIIKAQFDELKEWQMEVEIVSSPFYSS